MTERKTIEADAPLTKEMIESLTRRLIKESSTPTPTIPLPHGYTYGDACRWLAEKLGVEK